jgi:hypothetical protein
MAPILWD